MSPQVLFFIPTDRECFVVIDEQLAEAAWAASQLGERVLFCLIDITPERIASKHAAFLRARLPKGVTAIHLRAGIQHTLVERVTARIADAGEHERVRRLLLPQGVSYGRGPNLASLVGHAAGVGTFHRRDSDEFRDPDRASDYAVEMELEAIQHPLSTLRRLRRGGTDWPGNVPVAMAGTSMFGAPSIDRRDLLRAVPILAVELQALGRPGAPLAEVEAEAKNYLLNEPTIRYSDDFLTCEGNRVEMGSCCFSADLSSLLPEMPTGIIGCDYMRKDLAWQLHRPVVFHSRKVQHVHSPERVRASASVRAGYAVRDLQYLQVGLIWQRHGELLARALRSRAYDQSLYAALFRRAARELTAEIRTVRLKALEIYREARNAATSQRDREQFGEIATNIERRENAIDAQVQRAVRDFADLVELWPQVIEAATATAFEEIVNLSSGD